MPVLVPPGLTPADLIKAAQEAQTLVAVVFQQSASTSYPMAAALARAAAQYGEIPMGRRTTHMAVFGRSKEQATAAVALLKLVAGWRSVQVFTQDGIAGHAYEVVDVLDCYLKSMAARDPRAHCQWTYREPGAAHYSVPCRLLEGWFQGIIGDLAPGGADLADRVTALAARKGCGWCPRFAPAGLHSAPAHRRELA